MSKITVTGQITLTGGQLTAKETVVPPATGPQLWSWGKNNLGLLALDNTTYYSSPVQVGTLVDWSKISASTTDHAIKTDGTLWAWGNGGNGKQGLGDEDINRSSPVQVGSLTDWASIDDGLNCVFAIKTNGELWAWGNATAGRIGNGNAAQGNNKSSPIQIGGLTNWASVTAAGSGGRAVKTDGTLWVWGGNNSGTLGLGDTANRSSPVQVAGIDWADVSATNGTHTIALKTNGELWIWGRAADGRLGNGLAAGNISSPIQVGGLSDWAFINAGYTHSLAIKSNGSLWTWGLNTDGKLGHGDTASRSSPVQVGSLTDWSSVVSPKHLSEQAILALKTDGSLWAWGNNIYGQLGDGTIVSKSSPIQIGSDTNWTNIKAGTRHSLAIKTTT